MRNIFVFGSNTQGRHMGGAARYAFEHHGAIEGVADGIQGNSYAIPTIEYRPGYPRITVENIAAKVETFKNFARDNPDLIFEVTKIGCGIAGFSEEDIRPLFLGSPPNVNLPEGWSSE